MTAPEWFRAKHRLDELTVLATECWTWSLLPVQTTLGSGIVSVNRPCPAFGEMTPDEGRDLAGVVRAVEQGLTGAFAADRVNYTMFMMNDPHLHMLVFPRYSQARTLAGRTWTDEAWPGLLRFPRGGQEVEPDQLQQIRERLAGGAGT